MLIDSTSSSLSLPCPLPLSTSSTSSLSSTLSSQTVNTTTTHASKKRTFSSSTSSSSSLKKNRKSLSEAIQEILASKPKNPNVPILSKTSIEKKLEANLLDVKAHKILALEKKLEVQAFRQPVKETDLGLEKVLRKLATRGVVKLFNAIRQAQYVQQQEQPKSIVPRIEEQQEVTQAARTVFLDLLRKRPGPQTVSKLFSNSTTEASSHPSTATSTTISSSSSSSSSSSTSSLTPSNPPSWDIFAPDAMLDAKLNDWTMQEEQEQDMELDFV